MLCVRCIQGRYFVQREKIDSLVEFPTKGLDISPYVRGPQASDPGKMVYDLFAVSEHSGSLSGGHCTAVAKNFVTKRWFGFNDAEVSGSTAESCISPRAYVLFYEVRYVGQRRIGCKPPSTCFFCVVATPAAVVFIPILTAQMRAPFGFTAAQSHPSECVNTAAISRGTATAWEPDRDGKGASWQCRLEFFVDSLTNGEWSSRCCRAFVFCFESTIEISLHSQLPSPTSAKLYNDNL